MNSPARSSDRLLNSVTTPLPPAILGGLGLRERLTLLLERMMSVAGADTGVILQVAADGQLAATASHGLDARAFAALPSAVCDLQPGLTVHEARTEAGLTDASASEDGSRTVLWLPLEVNGALRGAVRLGFADLRTLETSEIQRLGMMADHAATAAEVARLMQQSADRQAEIARVSAVLDEIDRMKAEFLAMISHELRTPLTAIIGYTDLLLREIHGPLNERQSHHQEAVRKAAHRLLALINDLLDVNRLESGQITLNLEPISLVVAVRRAVSTIEGAAEQRGVSLRLDLPATTVTLAADRERLHQILVNLLDNAVKFTPAGGTVTIRVDQHGEVATVAVIDTGVGVLPEQLDRIWDRFHQADSSSRRHFGGTGLGLAIVRHLVEKHGGRVSAVSGGAGQGSTFSFTLPVTASAPRMAPAELTPSTPTDIVTELPKTVLVVDDEPDNREVITSIVRDVLGHRVRIAVDGREALLRAQDGPDLVLLDLRMPGLSGFEVARQLKASAVTADIPIVAITALNDEADRQEARDAGCIGCVTKPFSEAALTEAVSAALGSRERRAVR